VEARLNPTAVPFTMVRPSLGCNSKSLSGCNNLEHLGCVHLVVVQAHCHRVVATSEEAGEVGQKHEVPRRGDRALERSAWCDVALSSLTTTLRISSQMSE
jgi:hypothetical protein